jgi:hypothetical protein
MPDSSWTAKGDYLPSRREEPGPAGSRRRAAGRGRSGLVVAKHRYRRCIGVDSHGDGTATYRFQVVRDRPGESSGESLEVVATEGAFQVDEIYDERPVSCSGAAPGV